MKKEKLKTEGRFLIHVYGDSISLPRNSEDVPFYSIYPELVREKCEELFKDKKIHLFNMSRGSATVESVYTKLQRGSFYFSCKSEILIIQVGVCDCAPRPIPFWLRNGIGAMPSPLKNFLINRVHNNRASIQGAGVKWQMVVPNDFSAGYRKLLSDNLEEFDRIYVINVPPTNAKTELQSPGFSSQIEKYNELIKDAVEFVNSPKIFLVDAFKAIRQQSEGLDTYINEKDGHHLTLKAHKLYAQLIINDLEKRTEDFKHP